MCQLPNNTEKYLTYALLNTYKKRVKNAVGIVSKALKFSDTPALSFSSGKDSIVLLDIAVKAGFRGRLLFFKYGSQYLDGLETPEENIDLLKFYAEKYGLEYDILDCLGETDCWEQCGRFTLTPETDKEKQIFNYTNYDFKRKSSDFQAKYGIDLQIIGLRKAESNARRIMLSKKGEIYETKDRNSLTCCPLLNFTALDIWAYIFSNRLKYLSIYDYPYIDREKNRNECTMLYNNAIMRNGMMFHYRQMYPAYINAIEQRWGSVFNI